ncbi:amidohydrolase [Acidaminobacterium chupaoyuni]
MIAIKGGKVVLVDGSILENGTVLVEGGKIRAVGPNVEIPEDAEIINAKGKYVTPGLIDAHTHISTFNEPNWHRTRNDGNEMSGPIQAYLRGIDALNPFDFAMKEVREAGFTTCYTGPGSGNLIGGTGVAFKLRGKVADEMVIPGTEAMKMALGENPKTNYGPRDKSPMTRMGNAGVWRETLANAKNYSDRLLQVGDDRTKIGKYDFMLEALVPVVRGEMKARIHCHRADDICTAIRVAEEFGLDYTLEHATEGHLIAEYLGSKKARCVVGPLLMPPAKMELWNAIPENAQTLIDAGCMVCLTADTSSETKWLPRDVGVCMAHGLKEADAFKGVTINPAKLLGIDAIVGSLEPGKDADVAMFDGHPFSNMTRCVMTMIEGEIVYRASHKK